MNLSGLLAQLHHLPAYQDVRADGSREPLSLLEAARPFVAAALAVDKQAPVIILTARAETAQRWLDRLQHFLPPVDAGGPRLCLCAEPDSGPYERIRWTDRTRQQRLTALAALQGKGGPAVVVASVPALLQKTLPARELRMALRSLSAGSFVNLAEMTERWAQTGYEPVQVVEEPGTFARRGGIIDIWPPNLPHPVRIDLFGDEVESLRIFDPNTQRTEGTISRIEIGPGSEALSKYGPKALERLSQQAADGRQQAAGGRQQTADAPTTQYPISNTPIPNPQSPVPNPQSPVPSPRSLLSDPHLLLAIQEEISGEVTALEQGQSFRGVEWYLPYLYGKPASLVDHLPDNGLLLIDDAAALVGELDAVSRQAELTRQELVRSGELPDGFASSFFKPEEILTQIGWRRPVILGFGDLQGQMQSGNTPLARHFAPAPNFGGETRRIHQTLAKQQVEGQTVVVVTRQMARLSQELSEADTPFHQAPELTARPPRGITLLQGVMAEGFVIRGSGIGDWGSGTGDSGGQSPNLPISQSPNLPIPNTPISNTQSLTLLTDSELYGWKKPEARKQRKSSTVAPELFFADLKPGDFVVHMEHGIGQYDGLVKLELGGAEREYIQVNYAQGDKLYVPVHQADRFSRYVGAGDGGVPPAVTRLGTADWAMVKARAKKAVEEIAEDLLALYAEREIVPGHAFSPDNPWQEEMEAAFPFQETEDQLQAIDEVKRDMEQAQPMDRIIIGDVGYGKTEVAIRAAFKAVLDGKQAAVLVPTTVLAQQHYRTFESRLRQFPVKVEVLSRFRTQGQQSRVIAGLLNGSVDIVIGTHRLLSEDVTFKDLGLLVVDEEQRFGVSHKEKLKQLRTQVDVLTLSATPIPRTLHMSLSGVRDMSAIKTPPQERLPVRTVLSEYDEVLIRQAIQRELSRDGQIFFVHNRVMGLEQLAARVRHLVPEATVGVAHGQMPERQLEDAMLRFAEGEIDVLVCTTIVENGLDIRRANTILINRADHFGLAQLYQLRGRVGRSAVRGYCYLLYDKHKSLTFDARLRLEALMESSEELGAGFRIAMRDLEIRGAGELLGARQHGQIASVGFDLYTRLLAQAINDLRRKKEQFEQAAGGKQAAGRGAPRAWQAAGNGSTDAATQSPIPSPQSPVPSLPFSLDDPLAPPVTLDLPFLAEIPTRYVADADLRLQLYRRIAGMSDPAEIEAMRAELLDRFGQDPEARYGSNDLPEEVENLFYQIRVKILALRAGIPSIGRRRDQIAIRPEREFSDGERRVLQKRLREALGRLDADDRFREESSIHVGREAVYIPIDADDFWRPLLARLLEALAVELAG